MNDEDLEQRIRGLFAEVTPSEGMHRWEVAESRPEAAPRRGRLGRVPALRGADGSWRPMALAVGLALAVGAAGAAVGGVRLARDGGQAAAPPGPSGRLGAAVAFDPRTHVVVLFGGQDGTGQMLGDTWTWDGSGWRQLHPATSPSPRAAAAMAWDSASGRLVLAGGMSPPSPAPGGIPPCAPVPATAGTDVRSGTAAGGCAVASPAVGADGKCAIAWQATPPLDDTWTFDGSEWRQEHPAHPAGGVGPASMAARPGGGVVLAGGIENAAVNGAAAACPPPAQSDIAMTCGFGSRLLQARTRAVLWDGHDWSDLPPIPGAAQKLVTWGDTVLAVGGGGFAVSMPACLPAPAISLSPVPPGAPGHLPPAAPMDPVGLPTARPATSATTQPGATGGSVASTCAEKVLPPSTTGTAAAGTVFVLRAGAWTEQTVSGPVPVEVTAIASDGGQLLATDITGSTWTGDGKSWHNAGSTPMSFASAAAMVEDTDRHVAVLVGGLPATALPTWEWDGSAWHLRAGTIPTVPAPPGEPSILPAPASAPAVPTIP